MSILHTRQGLLFKIEGTSGVDAAPVPAADAILVRDFRFTIDQQQRQRPVLVPDLSNSPTRPGRRTITATFGAEIKGSGVAGTAPAFGKLLRAAGFAETELADDEGFEYDPVSSGFESATIHWYVDGLRYKILGARGFFNINAVAGEDAVANFTFQGTYADPADVAFPSGWTYEETLQHMVELSELNVLGNTACAQAYTIDVANGINPKMCVNSAQGVAGYNIDSRNVTGSFNPEAQLMAAFNPFTKLKNGDIGTWTSKLGVGEADNEVVITGNVQYTNVTPGNRNADHIYDIPVRFVRDTGDDEIKFAFPQSGV